MKQEYLIELINNKTEDSIVLQVENTNISIETIKLWIMQQEATQSCEKYHLQIIGNENCELELEDIFVLCKIIQAAILKPLSWDIIEKVLSDEDSNLVASLLLY